ncbi:CpsD/CapB family tyrosine-protein kinase [Chengkuizengella sp. SCS-71B]|uniref:CpsD/CapB family tyrosine-protein kinase n=1 Tax=Chengkuizengella sp. SCS-71B TaxID=3115290 RepID=UPI0032C2378B
MKLERKKDKVRLRSMLSFYQPKSIFSEQFRSIRSNIQFSSVDKSVKSILVTSSVPGEGKTTTAVNLAISFAQQGNRVLLVDTDLRKPTLHHIFERTQHRGLTNYLAGHYRSIEDFVCDSGIDNLQIVTSGPIPPNPAELLSASEMKVFMKEAFENYDMVVYDTSPVLAVTDAQILSNVCDGVILVIRSGKTRTEQVKKAKENLEQANAKILGAILNKKKVSKHESYYYIQ